MGCAWKLDIIGKARLSGDLRTAIDPAKRLADDLEIGVRLVLFIRRNFKCLYHDGPLPRYLVSHKQSFIGAPVVASLFCSRPLHGLDDPLITGATADVSGQGFRDLLIVGPVLFFKKRFGDHQDAGRAVAALSSTEICKRLL